jgi:urease accessory protein
MRNLASRLLTLSLVLSPTMAFAHPGHGETAGFMHGFVHPIGGLDHILAMVAVGILASQLGGRALWLLPSVFVGVMGLGWVAGAADLHLPFVETGIAASIVVLGAAIAFNVKAPVAIAAAIAGLFAVFHGFAHGAEMPLSGSPAQYAAGFLAATALLHLVGLGLGLALGRIGAGSGRTLYRVTGCAVAIAGAAILTQAVI